MMLLKTFFGYSALIIAALSINAKPVSAQSSNATDTPWVDLFDGKTLNGWREARGAGVGPWLVTKQGTIGTDNKTGTSPDYLVYWGNGAGSPQQFKDFILEADVKISAPQGNGGVMYRGSVLSGGSGYGGMQMDAGRGAGKGTQNYWWGLFYWNVGGYFELQNPRPSSACLATLQPTGWNSYRIEIKGMVTKHTLNNVPCLTYDFSKETTLNLNKQTQGSVGFQEHGAGDSVEYRNVRLVELPLKVVPTLDRKDANGRSGIGAGRFALIADKLILMPDARRGGGHSIKGDLRLTDIRGKKFSLAPSGDSGTQWSLPGNLNPGVYILTVDQGEGFSQRLVLQ